MWDGQITEAMKTGFLEPVLRRNAFATVCCLLFVFVSSSQIAAQCVSSVSGVPSMVDSCGGFYAGRMETGTGCSWSVRSDASWIRIVNVQSPGTGYVNLS